MDFEQQVNQALRQDITARRKQKIGLSVAGVVAVAAVLILLHLNQRIRIAYYRVETERKSLVESLAQAENRLSDLTGQLEQARKEITELNQQNNILSIQAGELKKQSEKSKLLAEQLNDTHTELDHSNARIKALLSELQMLRQSEQVASKPLALE